METTSESDLTRSNDEKNMEPQSQLRKLLLASQTDNEVWQETVGKLVSQLHVKTLNADTSDKEFLECIMLVAKAQGAGSKIAKKKNINVGRYKDRAPIDFSLFQDAGDQKIVLNLLSKVRAHWCLKFLSEILQNSKVDKTIISILVRWAGKCADSPADLWTAVISPLISSNIDERKQIAVIKEFEKCSIDFIKQQDPDKSILEFKELLNIISQTLNQITDSKKLSSAIISTTINYISIIRTEIPTSIIDRIFIAGISQFSITLKEKDQIKQWDSYRARLSKSAASVLNSLTKLLGPTSAEYWSNYLPSLIQAYPKFSDDLYEFESKNQFIKVLLGGKQESNISLNSQYEIETNVCNLLLNWMIFRNQHKNITETETLDVLIKNVGKSLDIEYFGNVGTTCDYDPIEHNLIDQGNTATSVTILQNGVIITRADGSKKILHPAIVK